VVTEIPVEDLPKLIAGAADWLATEEWEVHCPMGEAYGGKVVVCRKARDFLTIKHDPLAICMFCTSAEGYQQCPIWIGEKEGEGKIERTLAAREEAKVRQETTRHIESGLRVDDRGLEDEVDYGAEGVTYIGDDEEVSDGTS
jgi:hypothetical protein